MDNLVDFNTKLYYYEMEKESWLNADSAKAWFSVYMSSPSPNTHVFQGEERNLFPAMMNIVQIIPVPLTKVTVLVAARLAVVLLI